MLLCECNLGLGLRRSVIFVLLRHLRLLLEVTRGGLGRKVAADFHPSPEPGCSPPCRLLAWNDFVVRAPFFWGALPSG